MSVILLIGTRLISIHTVENFSVTGKTGLNNGVTNEIVPTIHGHMAIQLVTIVAVK